MSPKKVFAIYIPGKKENTGGHVVLHKLLKIMCDLGEEVWTNMVPIFDCNPNIIKKIQDDGTERYDMSFAEGKNLIALYPEQIKGNPFGANYVSRWILYHVNPSVEKTWNPKDEYFYYVPGFKTVKEIEDKKILSIVDAKLDIFHNHGLGEKRKGYCHINKKKYPQGEKLLKHLGSADLSDFMNSGGFSHLASEMNKYEFFVTYDDATFYSIAAAMCGCRSIILNTDPTISPDEWRNQFHMSKYGVAYGWNDLKHADMTRDMVRDFMKRTEKTSVKMVKDYIDFWNLK